MKTLEQIEKHLLYHYCDVETMHSIITEKKLWLSSARFMNDTYESVWIDEVVKEVLMELGKDSSLQKGNITKFKKVYKETLAKEHFLMCFSGNGDLLSQWRGYGDDAQGVAIGFSMYDTMSEILGLTSKSQSINGITVTTSQLGYEEVSYEIKSMIKELIKETLELNKHYEGNCIFIKEFSSVAKHDYFKEEDETRITYTPESKLQKEPNTHLNKILKRLSKKKYRIRGSELIPYFELDFKSEFNSLVMPKIVLGSKSKINQKDLEDFLKQNGFKSTLVEKSNAPYI